MWEQEKKEVAMAAARLLALLLCVLPWWTGCTTTVTTEDASAPFSGVTSQPQAPGKKQSKDTFKNTMTGAQALAFGAGNATKTAAQNVGKGAGWVAGEFMRPLNSMREGMIDAFGVVQKDKQ
jgi:hypothetical protein